MIVFDKFVISETISKLTYGWSISTNRMRTQEEVRNLGTSMLEHASTA